VKNFTPSPTKTPQRGSGDWLMARRNYQGWSHSPLTQVTRKRTSRAAARLVWSMNEGRRE